MSKVHTPKEIQITCVQCTNIFTSSRSQSKYCSTKCKNDFQLDKTGRRSKLDLSSGTVGAISELEVANDLMKSKYEVFRALSPACFCDLIAIKEGKSLNVEARTGYIGLNNKPSFSRKTRGSVDIFAVYLADRDKVMYYNLDLTEYLI